jgi:hypothetical protein
MSPSWFGACATIAIQIAVAIWLGGKFSERFAEVHRWMRQEAKPRLDRHEARITILEAHERP